MKKFLPLFFWAIYVLSFAQNGLLSEQTDDAAFSSAEELNLLTYPEVIDHTWMENLYDSPLYKNTEEKNSYEEFTSDLLKLRLGNLNNRTPFNVEYNAILERFIRLYLNTRKDDISNLMDEAKYYFPIFEEYLDKYNLPLEIKYLTIVESALKPNARSVYGAKGLWQFMYHTGKQFGLKVTSYVDERSDPIKSTEAACKYLESLYKTFGDWDLALAAYNSGPGNVSKAIRRSGGLRNYWNIRKYLPTETRGYLPAFYATYYLFEYGKEHDIYAKNSKITYFETDTVHVKKKLTFQKINEVIGIDKDLLKKLNPQYKLNIIPLIDEFNVLTLPKNYIGKFVSNENKIYNLPVDDSKREVSKYITPTPYNSYVVLQGDNLSKIAKSFEITVGQIKTWNGLETNYLIEGQSLVVSIDKKIYLKKNSPSTSIQTKNSFIKKSSLENKRQVEMYTVKEGDSLFLISKKFPDVSIHQIRNWNNMWNVSYVEPGTQLKILTETE